MVQKSRRQRRPDLRDQQRKFYHQPCQFGQRASHVWKSEHGDSLTFEGPSYKVVAYRSAGL
jgi:hypothetical protein